MKPTHDPAAHKHRHGGVPTNDATAHEHADRRTAPMKGDRITIESGVYPDDLLGTGRWFTWKLTDDGRKIPRAPWEGDSDSYISYKDESAHREFETAKQYADMLPGHSLASCILDAEPGEQRLIFIDGDDVRDPETGDIHPVFWAMLTEFGLPAWLSTSGTGVHSLVIGTVPDGYRESFKAEMPEWEHQGDSPPKMEVYARRRFIAATGEHIVGTPTKAPTDEELVERMFEKHGNERKTGVDREPEIERADLDGIETTTNIEKIYDAIALVRPSDISIRSAGGSGGVTEYNRGDDAVRAYHPSWESYGPDNSGTRLAEFDDHWLLREGNVPLDALQLVALEERIISDPEAYPSGEAFWTAVDALRDRGAAIPEYQRSGGYDSVRAAVETDGGDTATESTTDTSPGDDLPTLAEIDADRRDELRRQVQYHLTLYADDGDMNKSSVYHRVAEDMVSIHDFIYPRKGTMGWEDQLHVWEPVRGVYVEDADVWLRAELTETLGDFATRSALDEIVEKVENMTAAQSRTAEFDSPDHHIVVDNGILDLSTGELKPHGSGGHHRVRFDVEYDPDADCPKIDEFLDSLVEPKDRRTLRQLIAHMAYPGYPSEKAAMLVGDGGNGKTTFLELCTRFLGGENVSSQSLKNLTEGRWYTERLVGRRANLCGDMSDSTIRDAETFKRLTGGDTVEAEQKYGTPYEFYNQASLVFAVNTVPKLHVSDDRALWRRWIYINFPHTFDTESGDNREELLDGICTDEEFSGLLNVIVDEVSRWATNHDEPFFTEGGNPDEVRRKMKTAANPVYRFIVECLRKADELEHQSVWLTKDEVADRYDEYRRREGLPARNKDVIGRELAAFDEFEVSDGRTTKASSSGRQVPVYWDLQWTSKGESLGKPVEDDDGESQQGSLDPKSPVSVVDDEPETLVEAVTEYVRENPGCAKIDVLQHLSKTQPRGVDAANKAFEKASEKGRINRPGGSDGWEV